MDIVLYDIQYLSGEFVEFCKAFFNPNACFHRAGCGFDFLTGENTVFVQPELQHIAFIVDSTNHLVAFDHDVIRFIRKLAKDLDKGFFCKR